MTEKRRSLPRAPLSWRPNEPLSARRLTDLSRAAGATREGIRPPRQIVTAGQGRPATVQAMQIVSVHGDYLLCNPWDGVGPDVQQAVRVAKPPLLRQAVTERAGVSFAYTGTEGQARTATIDAETENQVVIPAYLSGDVIFAVQGARGGTGIMIHGAAVAWQDLNVDGRAWAEDTGA